MDLEQRVETLEQELQILKNQIQTTLLDIQEQILTNAYPSLRAEEISPPPGMKSSSKNGAPITTLSFNTPSTDETQGAMSGDSGSIPNVRQVSLDDLETDTRKPTSPKVSPTPQPTAGEQPLDWQVVEELEEWATDKVKNIGVKRTKKLVEMYAEQGRFSAAEEETLLQFVSLFEREQRQNSTHRDASRRQRKPKASEQPPRSKPATQSRQTRRAQPAENSRAEAPRKAATPKPADRPKPAPPPPPETLPEDEIFDESEHNLVLKLIAGVQNAGAGVRWNRKKHG
jgi:hypothetical protein